MAKNDTTTRFNADISELKSAFQEASRQIKLANSEFKAASSGMEDWNKSADGVTAKLSQLDKVLDAQKKQLKSLNDQYELTVKEYGENSAAAENLKIKINNQQAAINATQQQINSYNQQLENMQSETQNTEAATDKLDDTLEHTDTTVKNTSDGFSVMKGVLADLVSAGIQKLIEGVKNLASDVLEVGKNFESSMSNVAALSGATGDELEMLEDTARKYGATTQYSASQAADALGYMALAGWDANQSASALGGVLDLAASSGMELAEASDMVTDYMSAFSMEADESAYFADLLAYAQANANTTAAGLGEAFKNCAANMNASGQDIETTVSLLSMLANQGFKGSEAGTAISAMMRDMTDKMKTYNDELELAQMQADGFTSITGNMNDILGKSAIQIGNTLIPVSDLNGNYRDMTDVLKDIEKATDGMGDAQKAMALSSSFTSKSIKGVNMLLNAGIDEAENFEQELRNASGSASEMAKVMNDNLSGDLKSMNSAYEEFALTIYESVNNPLRDVVKNITSEVLPAFTDMVNGVEGAGTEVGKAVGGLVNNIVSQIMSMLPKFAEIAISLVTSILSGLLDSLPDIINAVVQMTTTILDSLSKMLPEIVNKILDIIPNIVNALMSEVPTLLDSAIEFLMTIVKAIPEIIPILAKAIPQIINSVTETLITGVNTLTDGAVQLFMGIVDAIPEIIHEIIKTLPDIIKSIVNLLNKSLPVILDASIQLFMAIVDAIPEIIPEIVRAIPEIIRNIVNLLAQSLPVILDASIQLLMAIIDAIPLIIEALVPQIPIIIKTIANLLIENIPVILNAAVQVFMSIIKAIPTLLSELGKALSKFGDFFKPALTSLWESIQETLYGFFEAWETGRTAIKNFFTNLWDDFQQIFQDGMDIIVGFLADWWENLKSGWQMIGDFFVNLWDDFQQIFQDGMDIIVGFFKDSWNNLKLIFISVIAYFISLWDGFKDSIISGWQIIADFFIGVWENFKSGWNAVGEFFQSIWTALSDFIISVWDNVTGFFLQSWESIKSGAEDAWNFISEVWNIVSDWFNETIIIPVSTFFSSMWDNLVTGAVLAWEGIKTVFSVIVEWFSTKFTEAWTAVKNVFSVGGKIFDGIKEGITSAFTTVVNAIIRGINKVIAFPFNSINNVLDTLRNLSIMDIQPFGWISDISVPKIPELREGGVLRKGKMGFLEGDGDEAVVPLEKNTRWINEVADRISRNMGVTNQYNSSIEDKSVTNNFYQTNNSPKALSRLEIYRQSKNLLKTLS